MLSVNTCREILNRIPVAGKVTLTKDTVAGIIYAVSVLEADEQTVLLLLCQENLPYDEIAKKMDISSEDVLALEKVTLRKLRQTNRWNYVQYGVAGYLRMRLAQERNEAYRRGFAAGYQNGQTAKEPKPLQNPDMPVEMLELSYRSVSCLKRAGLHTVGEVMALHEEQIRCIRGMGNKTAAEVANALQKAGLSCPLWEMFRI